MNLFTKHSLFLLLVICFLAPNILQAQNALNFDGANDFVQTTYPGVFGIADRTFEAWINLSPSASGNNCIMDYGLNAASSRNTFAVSGTNQLLYIAGGTNTNISSSANAVPDGVWTHVALVMSSGTGFLYVNGVQVGTGPLTGVNTPTGNANLRIGQRVSGGSIPFEGSIDEVRVWDVARTAAEIMASMNSEFCVPPSSLKAYYQFNQGIAGGSNTGLTTLTDNSGSANDGTLTGFALTGATSNWALGATLTSTVSNAGTSTVSDCIPFTSLGNQSINATGMYQDTVVMANGCDSIYTLDFTALVASASTIDTVACDSYSAPNGTVYTSSGTYQDTLVNAAGCDSIVTTNLTINNSSSSSISPSVCNSYTSPLGNVYTVSGTYTDTFQNAAGCDSLLQINLTILNYLFSTQSDTACDSYASPSGQIWTSSGVYLDTVVIPNSCDSIYAFNLVINPSANTSITESSCGPYTSNQGNVYDTTGVYTETLAAANGCDSIITLDLTITNIDSGIVQNGFTLSANQSGAVYQWINCADQSAIAGADGQTYTPATIGSYAVQIVNGMCAVQSECIDVTSVGIKQMQNAFINLYPNPTTGLVSIDLGETLQDVVVRVVNTEGRIVQSLDFVSAQTMNIELGQTAGIYTVQIYTKEGFRTFRVLKID